MMCNIKKFPLWLGLLLIAGLHFDAAAQVKTGAKPTSRFGDSPVWADTIRNPYSSASGSAAAGKLTYMQLCSVCHGNLGKGDGIAAASLAVKPADHTSDRIQKQSDGSLYYELTNGHAPMPAYKTVLTNQQRWQLICYIRTLKALPKKPGK